MKLREGLKLTRTERFKKSALDLDPQAREKLRKQLGILISSPRHPSLAVKKIKGTKSIFEARVDDHFRFTFEYGERNEIILRVVGAKRLKQIQAFCERVPIFALDLLAAAYAGKIYTDLKSKGMTVGNQDILIAGACLANGLPLLTRNAAHFTPIKGLVIY